MSDATEVNRELILTVYGEDIPTLTKALSEAEPCPSDYKLDLALVTLHDVKRLNIWSCDFSKECDANGNSRFATFSIIYVIGKPA